MAGNIIEIVGINPLVVEVNVDQWLSLREEGAPKGLGTCVNEGLEVLPSIND
jgi:hypothetical protein